MTTLTETARTSRKVIKWGAIGLAVILGLRLIIGVWSKYLKVVKPKPPPPPTVSFGKLPSIVFPEKTHPELTLRLETPTGGTPDLGDRVNVFLMPTFRSDFLALDQAKETAERMRFRDVPKEITARRYRWENNEFLPSTLEMDIIDGSFELRRNWQSDPTTLTEKQLPGKEQAVIEAKNWLRQARLLTKEMETARTEVSYLTSSAGQYKSAISLSEADFVEVNMFRAKIEDNPVLTAEPEKGIIQIIFSGARETQKKIVWADYNYFPVDKEQSATYPIKPASQAWRELQTKQGYIAAVGDNSSGAITIRRIYLGYYDSKTPQEFLTPIIVFEGDGGFFGYVQAVTNEWLQEPVATGGG